MSEKNNTTLIEGKPIKEYIETIDIDEKILGKAMNKDLDVSKVETMDDLKEKGKFRGVFNLLQLNEKFNESLDTKNLEMINEIISVLDNYNNNFVNHKIEFAVKKVLSEHNIIELNDDFLKLAEEDRLMIARHWGLTSKLTFGCGGDFGYYKKPSTCGSCSRGRDNTEKAGLDHLLKPIGDRRHRIPKKEYDIIKNKFCSKYIENFENDEDKINPIIGHYKSHAQTIDKERKAEARRLKGIQDKKNVIEQIVLLNENLDLEQLENKMKNFLSHVAGSGYQGITVDIENKIGAYIEGTSRDSGSGGMEYGNYVCVWYNGNVKRFHVVYRDAYHQYKDDRSLSFDKATIDNIEIKDNEIEITFSGRSDSNKRTYKDIFELVEEEEKDILSFEETEAYRKNFEEKKKEIFEYEKGQYAGKTMPTYALHPDSKYDNMPGGETPYSAAMIDSEYFDETTGRGSVVIRKQIGYRVGLGREYGIAGYVINIDGSYSRVRWETTAKHKPLVGGIPDAKSLLID